MPTSFPNLQSLLEDAELSQGAVADAVGVRRATVNAWANGGNVRADFDVVAALCKLLTKHLGRDITITELRKKPRRA